jgi:hypothetical protein
MAHDTGTSRWFLREPSAESGARLFCLPYSGCGASMYRRWPRFLGDIEVCPVQFPGRENRFREDPSPPRWRRTTARTAGSCG